MGMAGSMPDRRPRSPTAPSVRYPLRLQPLQPQLRHLSSPFMRSLDNVDSRHTQTQPRMANNVKNAARTGAGQPEPVGGRACVCFAFLLLCWRAWRVNCVRVRASVQARVQAAPPLLALLVLHVRGPEREVVAQQLHDQRRVLVRVLGERVQLCDCVVERLLGQVARALRRVHDLVVEDRKVERQAEADRVGRGQLRQPYPKAGPRLGCAEGAGVGWGRVRGWGGVGWVGRGGCADLLSDAGRRLVAFVRRHRRGRPGLAGGELGQVPVVVADPVCVPSRLTLAR